MIFGCWASVSRKSVFADRGRNERFAVVLPGSARGAKSCQERSVLHRRGAGSKRFWPVDYLMSKAGSGIWRWVLLGTDYVYPAPPT
jgi:urea transport system substrate-binding protein